MQLAQTPARSQIADTQSLRAHNNGCIIEFVTCSSALAPEALPPLQAHARSQLSFWQHMQPRYFEPLFCFWQFLTANAAWNVYRRTASITNTLQITGIM